MRIGAAKSYYVWNRTYIDWFFWVPYCGPGHSLALVQEDERGNITDIEYLDPTAAELAAKSAGLPVPVRPEHRAAFAAKE